MTDPIILAAALEYAAAGIFVFPASVTIGPDGKKKVWPCRDWDAASTTDAEHIRKVFGPGATYTSVCIDTGKSGLVVVDADGPAGIAAWAALLPIPTAVATTPGGGEHWYYKANPDHPVTIDSSGKVAPGVDVRGQGGFVIAAPSADARGTYAWQPSALRGDRLVSTDDLPLVPLLVIERMGRSTPVTSKSTPGVQPTVTSVTDPFAPPARPFTADQAAVYCRAQVAKLESARQGINHHLFESAVLVGHFVPAFLPHAAAVEWLREAQRTAWLARGGADDGDYTAALRTITGGLERGMAEPYLRVEPSDPLSAPAGDETAGADPDRPSLEVMAELGKLRVRAQAREMHDAERHAAGWKAPEDFGSLKNELTLPDEAPRFRVAGLLGQGHNAVLVAGRKAGKTTTVNELVRSLVDDEPFLGRFEVTPAVGDVAIFNYEVESAQYRRWLREVGIVNTGRVHVLHLRGKALPVADARVRAWVTDWLREREIETWIVDPYSRAYVGSVDNGNDEAKVGTFLDHLDRIKAEAGVAQLVMPVHSPKAKAEAGEESAIGSQRLEAWPDALWYLTRDLESGSRFLRAEGRDIDHPEEKLAFDESSRRLSIGGHDRATEKRRGDQSAVEAFVRANPGCGFNDIAGGLEWGKERAQKAVKGCAKSIRKDPPDKFRVVRHWIIDHGFSAGEQQ